MSKRIFSLAIAIVLVSAFAAFAQNGEYEAVSSSNLTSVSLPSGAQRVSPNHVPAEVDQALDKVVAESGGKLRRGATEVLLWTGSDLKKGGARTIVSRLSDTLKVAGWKYETAGTEGGITFFTALKDGAERRAVAGFHGEAEGTMFFAWTELEANDGTPAKSPANTSTAPVNTTGKSTGSVADYEVPTPAGWSRSDTAGKIILTNGEDKMIAFLPPMDSSGDLQRDADRILWQVFKGHDTWYGNGFQPDYGTFERGRTVQGLEYFQAFRYAKKASDPNEGFVQSRFDALILVVKLGDKVAVAVASQPFQSAYYSDSAATALDRILYDLKFRNVPNNYNLKSDVIGSWSAASSTVALAYTFNPNGSFNKGGAIEFRTRRDRDTDHVQTTSYGMTETYSIAGNIMTQTYKRTGQVSKQKIRVYETKYDKDPWKQKMGWLPLGDNPRNETIVLGKNE